MKFLLGSDTALALIRQEPEAYANYLAQSPGDVAICTMTEADLRSVARRHKDATWLESRLEPFLDSLPILSFDRAAAKAYADFKLVAEVLPMARLKSIPVSIALANKLTYVTHFDLGFDEVPGLKTVDWFPSFFRLERKGKRR